MAALAVQSDHAQIWLQDGRINLADLAVRVTVDVTRPVPLEVAPPGHQVQALRIRGRTSVGDPGCCASLGGAGLASLGVWHQPMLPRRRVLPIVALCTVMQKEEKFASTFPCIYTPQGR